MNREWASRSPANAPRPARSEGIDTSRPAAQAWSVCRHGKRYAQRAGQRRC
ncbi:MAG: hypothetical protein MZV64_19275 [Ignavibacteriales bacterium]|nr:hypothetical protein [Ignavibacteriales bacterium]